MTETNESTNPSCMFF